MDVLSTQLDRWQERAPPEASRAAPRELRQRAIIGAPNIAQRVSFLTADGQTATALEQEALFDANDMVEANFVDRLQLVSRCVGRLRFQGAQGRGYATGSLVAPGLLMTNHHVFPDEASAAGAVVEFDYRFDVAGQLGVTDEYDLLPGEFFVADQQLDVALVAVAPRSTTGAQLAARGYLRLNPQTGKVNKGEFVTIVQHPDGLPMRFALRENEVTRIEQNEPVLWYRADTAHGSSGAPVFNDSFQIVALHSSGRIERNAAGQYRLVRGGWADSLEGLLESDVVWEANVGMRVSRVCEALLVRAKTRSAVHCATLEAAMRGGDVLAGAVSDRKTAVTEGIGEAKTMDDRAPLGGPVTVATSTGAEIVIPLRLRISVEVAGAGAASPTVVPAVSLAGDLLQAEAMKMRIPVIHDGLEERGGFDRRFLDPSADVPMPVITEKGKALLAPLIGGGGETELKYHKFSLWMHRERRLALFTAANVDWRARKSSIDGQKLTRKNLAGFPETPPFAEQWVTDPRIAAGHQLPDLFYTEDRQAFDKGHLVRRDDVCWGDSFDDIQKGNGDTYHVTNCSPQIMGFNQGDGGVDNWGDLESHIEKAAKADQERVVVYAGPVFGVQDRWFRGKDDSGPVRVQVPNRYWKIVLAPGGKAYGFVLRQDVRAITEKEFFVTENWFAALTPLDQIEKMLRGWISLDDLIPLDQHDAVEGTA